MYVVYLYSLGETAASTLLSHHYHQHRHHNPHPPISAKFHLLGIELPASLPIKGLFQVCVTPSHRHVCHIGVIPMEHGVSAFRFHIAQQRKEEER